MWDTSKAKINFEDHISVCIAFSCEQEHNFAKFKTHLSVTFLGITCCCCLSWCHDNVGTLAYNETGGSVLICNATTLLVNVTRAAGNWKSGL